MSIKDIGLPFKVDSSYGAIGNVIDRNEETVVQVQERIGRDRTQPDIRRDETAAFVATACNNHLQLLAHLRSVCNALEGKRTNDGDKLRMAEARALLRQLEGR